MKAVESARKSNVRKQLHVLALSACANDQVCLQNDLLKLYSLLNFQISALYDYLPSINDTQPHIAWLAVQQEALINLSFLVKISTLLKAVLVH